MTESGVSPQSPLEQLRSLRPASIVARIPVFGGTCSPASRQPAVLGEYDLERLRYALGRKRIDPQRTLFETGSVTWKVNREAILLLGGGRALLLQVAHPLIAAGVAEHSDFRQRPLERLKRTLELTLRITFGSAAEAIQAVRAIERVHARVRGRLVCAVGPFPRGTEYDANDPTLLFWVHATLVDTALLVYERFVSPLAEDERKAYYRESEVGARIFGIPPHLIPRSAADFREYFETTLGSGSLAVGRAATKIADSILRPPLPIGARQAALLLNLVTAGLLPPALREAYRLPWSGRRDTALRALAAVTRRSLPNLPEIARVWPQARSSLQRQRGR